MKKKLLNHLLPPEGLFRVVMLAAISFMMVFQSGPAAGAMYSQTVKVDIDLKNASLEDVFEKIRQQTELTFVYNVEDVAGIKGINLNMKETTVRQVLDRCLKDTGLSYILKDKVIVIRKEEPPVKQPERGTVTGTILDEDGMPAAGAAVMLKNTGTGVLTDVNGNYTLNYNAVDPVLEISLLGYEKIEVPIGQRSVINFTLEIEAKMIGDIVVTGYQTLSRERASGSFETVPADILSRPTTNIGSSLIGTVPGLQGTTDAKGNFTELEIRGRSTLYANKAPLVVVDGFEIEGDLSTLNPHDIESITLLKDAAAASIWGARSANGVISITTKGSGKLRKAQPVRVEFSTFFKYAPKIDLEYLRPLASTNEIIDYEILTFNNYNPLRPADGFTGASNMAGFTPTLTAMNEHYLGFLTEAEMNAVIAEYRNYDNSSQIKKYLLQNPFTQQYNLNISGASERMTHNFSTMYESNSYQKKGEDDWKVQAGYRTNVALARWVDFNFNGSYTYIKSTDNSIGSPLQKIDSGNASDMSFASLARHEMLFDKDGNMNNLNNDWYLPNIERHSPIDAFPYPFFTNPVMEIESRELTRASAIARAQAGFTFKIMEGLNIATTGFYEYYNEQTRGYYTEQSRKVRKIVNEGAYYDRNAGTVTTNYPLGGILDQDRRQTDRWEIRAQINFQRTFADRHDVVVLAGAEARNRVLQTFEYARTYGHDKDRMTTGTFPNGPGSGSDVNKRIYNWYGTSFTIPYTGKLTYRTDRYVSAYANASYTFDNKYTVDGSVRNDASNLITDDPKYRYSPFWSVGGTWQIAREQFMANAGWVNRLALRLTYGYNGNVDSSTSFMPLLWMYTTPNTYTGAYTADIDSHGNPTLRWEKVGTWNLGVDYSLFGNRLFGKVEFYNKQTKDMIAQVSLPSVFGTSSQKINNGEMLNRGFEMEIGTRQKIWTDNITWTGSLNVSYNYNKITKLFVASYPGYALMQGAYVEGRNVNSLYSYNFGGSRNMGSDSSPNIMPVIRGAYDEERGEYDYYSLDNMLSAADPFEITTYSGTTNAPWVMGFVNSFKIFDFDLSFVMSAKMGHKFHRTGFNYPQVSRSKVLPNKYYNEVINGDPDRIATLPTDMNYSGLSSWQAKTRAMDYMVENAGHIRMREINISYNLPGNALRSIGIYNLKVFAQVNNVFNIYFNSYNEDPEYRLGSVRPRSSFIFGFNATF